MTSEPFRTNASTLRVVSFSAVATAAAREKPAGEIEKLMLSASGVAVTEPVDFALTSTLPFVDVTTELSIPARVVMNTVLNVCAALMTISAEAPIETDMEIAAAKASAVAVVSSIASSTISLTARTS